LGHAILMLLLILLLGQALQPHPRLLGIALQKDLILLDLTFFFYIFYAKTIDPRHHAGYVTSDY